MVLSAFPLPRRSCDGLWEMMTHDNFYCWSQTQSRWRVTKRRLCTISGELDSCCPLIFLQYVSSIAPSLLSILHFHFYLYLLFFSFCPDLCHRWKTAAPLTCVDDQAPRCCKTSLSVFLRLI